MAQSSPWNLEAWEHDIFRSAVDTIATYTAKGMAKHVVTDSSGRVKETRYSSRESRLINEKPNAFMSGYDLKYRLISQLETKTTAIAYLDYKDGKLQGIYPLDYQNFEFRKVLGEKRYAIEYTDIEGETGYVNLEDCIVMRKFYLNNQVAGDGNAPIYKVLDMAKASDEGLVEALAVSNKVRGLVKNTKAMLDPEDIKKSQAEFAERFAKAAKNGGILAIDSMEDFKELYANTLTMNAAQMKEISNRIYSYMRISEKIIQNTYTETEGLAFMEGRIEPLWQQLAEAFTNALFTKHERECGNKIIFSGGIMTGTSIQTRVQVLAATKETGELSTNERRELLGFAPVEDGDNRQISLNYVKDVDQSGYQTGKQTEVENPNETGGDSDVE
ncbi:MAG: phage portal protein [Lachnospiraceae bacterium]|nr:phage portal protein [Lachnospiraceae bacterium]